MRSLAQVVIRKQEELLITFSTIAFLLIIASSLMFFAEHEAQPEAFSSIPAAMWWGVVTLTTVGYGDIYPITVVGKLLGASLAFFGIGVFVLPAGIVASGFAEEVKYGIEPEEENFLPVKQTEPINQYQRIEADAKLLKYCLQTARKELNDLENSQEAINSWTILLYIQAKEDNNIETG